MHGFVGSAIVKRLTAQEIEVVNVSAPRVTLAYPVSATRVAENAGRLSEVHELADALGRCDVVVNAAGLATPNSTSSSELFGANALVPAIAAHAAQVVGADRFIHISSAAVQGRQPVLDELPETSPFSPYSQSKALGEEILGLMQDDRASEQLKVVILRATSVQGEGRGTTESLRQVARSRFASVAGPGTQPTVVSSIHGLVDFILFVGTFEGKLPRITLQPWERGSARSVLHAAGSKDPHVLPTWMCRLAVATGYTLSGISSSRLTANVRRLELMWFGQYQTAGWAEQMGFIPSAHLEEVLSDPAGTKTRG